MKIKDKTTTFTYQQRVEYYRRFNGTTFTSDFGSQQGVQKNTVTYGDNYRDWKERLRTRIQATTNLSVDSFTVNHGRFNWTLSLVCTDSVQNHLTTIQSEVARGIPALYTPGFADSADLTYADNMAKTKFLKHVRSTRNQFQGGVFLGELREAVHMIRHPAQSLLRGIDSYLHAASRNVGRAIRRVPTSRRLRVATGVLGDTWLEYSFGWSPFIKDISDAVKALERRSESYNGKPVYGKGTSEARSAFRSTASYGSIVGIRTLDLRFEQYIVIYRGFVSTQLDKLVGLSESSSKTASLLGFSAEQILPTIWELVPWSFLSDYFVNLDDIIESASTSTHQLRWVNRTEVKLLTARLQYTHDPQLYASLVSPDATLIPSFRTPPFASTATRKKVTRAPYVGSLVPSLRFNFRLRDLQLANVAALLSSKTFSVSRELRNLVGL